MAQPPAAVHVVPSPWVALRELTQARIALGRVGTSMPTAPHLDFQFAHARARDAVHQALDTAPLREGLIERGHAVQMLHSAAGDRHIYLRRPDQGRRLDEASRRLLRAESQRLPDTFDVAFVIADGLSALAIQRHALPFLDVMLSHLGQEDWRIAPMVLVQQARVAIGDEIGEALRAQMVAVLIGERPGLSSPDSMGIYLSFAPRIGLSDAQRNCISNIRREGLAYAPAAQKLHYLMSEARRRRLTGVLLKDDAALSPLEGAGRGSFLIDKARRMTADEGRVNGARDSA